MTEQMIQALQKAANGMQWANGQIVIDKETFKPQSATTPFENLVCVPIPDKIKTAVLFGANWYRNNVWHQPNEKPDYDRHIFAVTNYSVYAGYFNGVNPATIVMWAYKEDLLPEMKYNQRTLDES